MRQLLFIFCVALALSLLTLPPVYGQSAKPRDPATIVVKADIVQANVPSMGTNEFGDIGGTSYSVNNFITDPGFEPASTKRYFRVTTGSTNSLQVDNMSDWLLNNEGFLDGAEYRIYRIVDAAGAALPEVDGYLDLKKAHHVIELRSGTIPAGGWIIRENDERIVLEKEGPKIEKWDYMFCYKRVLNYDVNLTHPRVRRPGNINTVWQPRWGDPAIAVDKVAHGSTLPDAFKNADPGESALRIVVSAAGEHSILGPALFYRADPTAGEAKWYGQLESGKRYVYDAWMRAEGFTNKARVALSFQGMYEGLYKQFELTNEWKLYRYTFIAPAPTTDNPWHGLPRISVEETGTVFVDNIRLSRIDDPAQDDLPFVPGKTTLDELMASQPATGPKGPIRSIGVALTEASLTSLLRWHPDSTPSIGDYQSLAGYSWTIPKYLSYALATGSSASTRMKPILNIPTMTTPNEWKALTEYLSGLVNPADPSEAQRKPWAWLRYQQRGTVTPWTDEFAFIAIEFANETWHNGAVSSTWRGYGRTYWVHSGGAEFGLFAHHWIEAAKAGVPDWSARKLDQKIRFIMGSNYGAGYAEEGWPHAKDVQYLGHANYVGPKWETGDAQLANFDDHGVQATLLGSYALKSGLESFAAARDSAAKAAGLPKSYDLIAYEGGASGYSMGGDAAKDEIAEQYGKSLAMGTASLDTWLLSTKLGWTEQLNYHMGQGSHWSSHTQMLFGWRRHASWLALTLRNRYASGDMVTADVQQSPSMLWDKNVVPLVSGYAFRNGSTWSVFALSLKLDGNHDGVDFGDGATPVTISLPFSKTPQSVRLAKLSGNPRLTNRNKKELDIEVKDLPLSVFDTATRTITIDPSSGGVSGGLPAGSIYCYIISEAGENPAPPMNLRVQ